MKAQEQGYSIILVPNPTGNRRWRLTDERAGAKSNEAGMDSDQLRKIIEGDEEERHLQGLDACQV